MFLINVIREGIQDRTVLKGNVDTRDELIDLTHALGFTVLEQDWIALGMGKTVRSHEKKNGHVMVIAMSEPKVE